MNQIGCVLLFAASCVLGQEPARITEFEVASIKPSNPDSVMAIRRSGNRLATTNCSLEKLITWAYDIPGDRLYGKPKWLDSVRYDITAQGPPGPLESGGLQRMMQTLLATRFHLSIHRETRELSLYVLVVDHAGPKVRVTESSGEIGQNPFRMSGRGHLTGTQVTAGMLAKVLSDQLGRAVQDMTGLQGLFDFTLEWAPEGDAQSMRPSIFTALPEQLGLRLESRKGPAEVIVIDRMESTPTEN